MVYLNFPTATQRVKLTLRPRDFDQDAQSKILISNKSMNDLITPPLPVDVSSIFLRNFETDAKILKLTLKPRDFDLEIL